MMQGIKWSSFEKQVPSFTKKSIWKGNKTVVLFWNLIDYSIRKKIVLMTFSNGFAL